MEGLRKTISEGRKIAPDRTRMQYRGHTMSPIITVLYCKYLLQVKKFAKAQMISLINILITKRKGKGEGERQIEI